MILERYFPRKASSARARSSARIQPEVKAVSTKSQAWSRDVWEMKTGVPSHRALFWK
jgi:hypothetical protein